MNAKKWQTVKILGIKVDFPTLKQAVVWSEEQVKYNKVGQITTPNPEQVVLCQRDSEFRGILNRAELSICDGAGLVWAARKTADNKNCSGPIYRAKNNGAINGTTTNYHRLSGVDLMLALCRKAAQNHWRVFLLGGRNSVAKAAVKQLAISYQLPACQRLRRRPMAGRSAISYSSGSPDISHESSEDREKIIKEINKFCPQLLFVAYGAPWQEKWIAGNLPRLKVNVAMGVGGAFDYLAGRVPRAPKIGRDLGLEWLWRLILQPWRLKRQLALLKFVWLVIKKKGFQPEAVGLWPKGLRV